MSNSQSLYAGREQSRVKHFLLQKYLLEMAYKVAQSRREALTAINYVDGFSGPWRTQDETGYSDTSFRQAINVLRTVRTGLEQTRNAKLPVRFVFCEANRKRHAKLLDAVKRDTDVEIYCIQGRFENRLEEIAKVCRNDFTFTFVDPTGFALKTKDISKFLRSQRGEFLWNFMADHANRFLEREGLESAYGNLLAREDWIERLRGPGLEGLPNEQKIVTILRGRLKDLQCCDYLVEFPVMRPRENRVQFRLLFGTRKSSGVAVFRSVQRKAEEFQAVLREEIRQEEKAGSLIRPKMHAESLLASEGIDGTKAKFTCPDAILRYLSQNGPTRFRDLVAPILETERVTEPGLKDVLGHMRDKQEVAYNLPASKRKPQGNVKISLPL